MDETQKVDVLAYSVIVQVLSGDCTILDYYRDGEVYSDGPYSLSVAKYLRPDAEVREETSAIRHRDRLPTEDMLDRARAA